jgi:hypothetical protein
MTLSMDNDAVLAWMCDHAETRERGHVYVAEFMDFFLHSHDSRITPQMHSIRAQWNQFAPAAPGVGWSPLDAVERSWKALSRGLRGAIARIEPAYVSAGEFMLWASLCAYRHKRGPQMAGTVVTTGPVCSLFAALTCIPIPGTVTLLGCMFGNDRIEFGTGDASDSLTLIRAECRATGLIRKTLPPDPDYWSAMHCSWNIARSCGGPDRVQLAEPAARDEDCAVSDAEISDAIRRYRFIQTMVFVYENLSRVWATPAVSVSQSPGSSTDWLGLHGNSADSLHNALDRTVAIAAAINAIYAENKVPASLDMFGVDAIGQSALSNVGCVGIRHVEDLARSLTSGIAH